MSVCGAGQLDTATLETELRLLPIRAWCDLGDQAALTGSAHFSEAWSILIHVPSGMVNMRHHRSVLEGTCLSEKLIRKVAGTQVTESWYCVRKSVFLHILCSLCILRVGRRTGTVSKREGAPEQIRPLAQGWEESPALSEPISLTAMRFRYFPLWSNATERNMTCEMKLPRRPFFTSQHRNFDGKLGGPVCDVIDAARD